MADIDPIDDDHICPGCGAAHDPWEGNMWDGEWACSCGAIQRWTVDDGYIDEGYVDFPFVENIRWTLPPPTSDAG